jgi:hypothetical protein
MSGLLGAAMPTLTIRAKEMMLHPTYRMQNARPQKTERSCALHMPCGYRNDFWPGNRGFVGAQGADVGVQDATWARRMERTGHGMASRVGFPGITRDQFGAPLGECTVILHRTSTREYVYSGVSDTSGAFLAQSVYAGEGHYIVFHKAGAINVYGATDNNLVGA